MDMNVDRTSYPRRRLGAMSCPVNERILYECPAGKSATIQHIHVTSTHTGSETFRLHHLRQDETSSVANALFYDYSLAAKNYVHEDTIIYMNPGERLVASAPSASRITITVYGIEQ